MASIKKFNGTTWGNTKVRKLTTATDTITTLPADLYADGNNATVGLKGNTVQNGTPTPDNPIQPNECGDLETTGEHAGQYKIPISSANTTTPVYLGEVSSTRQIKKLVLTGEETYIADASYSRFIVTFPNVKIEGLRLTQVYCTHFISVYDGRSISEVPNNSIYSSDVAVDRFFIKTTDYTSETGFKAFLAAQYAAGTPVTVWYVLTTPETAVVNEPLRKIGEYVDTVGGITIPTITGKDTFDVLTTLKPSEVSLTYTGWHDATVKEWDGSEWE